jgi:hypothetical protein
MSDQNIEFNTIVNNLFINGIKPSINIDEFLNHISEASNYCITWRTNTNSDGTILYMFSLDWNIKNPLPKHIDDNQNFIPKFFNNLVIDENYNIVMYSGPKVYDSNRDKLDIHNVSNLINFEECKLYNAYEGTSINVYFWNDEWFFSTKKKFDMFDSTYGSNTSHGQMFEEIITKQQLSELLNQQYTYHFVLVHPNNSHLSTIEQPNLILTAVRDRLDNFKSINVEIDHPSIIYPECINSDILTTLDNQDNLNVQGIIINYNDTHIFRIYNKVYGSELIKKPKYATIQEKLFHTYQQNLLNDESDEKTETLAAINYISIILFRILKYFTKFVKDESGKVIFEKIARGDDYDIIKKHNKIIHHLNRLQYLPRMIPTLTDIECKQVKYHLKNASFAKDLAILFNIFYTNNDITDMIRYKHLNKTVSSNIDNFANKKF